MSTTTRTISERAPAGQTAAASYSPQVNDLALFFDSSEGGTSAVWISHSVYTDKSRRIDSPPLEWTDAIFLEKRASDGSAFYVLNLAKLLPPGVAPQAETTGAAPAGPQPEAVQGTAGAPPSPGPTAAPAKGPTAAPATPGSEDLVVIPFDEPQTAYLVSRTTYESCPELDQTSSQSSDLVFMVFNQGVALANLPKPTDNTGWTCTLLSLLSLRSAAVTGTVASRAAHYDRLAKETLSARAARLAPGS